MSTCHTTQLPGGQTVCQFRDHIIVVCRRALEKFLRAAVAISPPRPRYRHARVDEEFVAPAMPAASHNCQVGVQSNNRDHFGGWR